MSNLRFQMWSGSMKRVVAISVLVLLAILAIVQTRREPSATFRPGAPPTAREVAPPAAQPAPEIAAAPQPGRDLLAVAEAIRRLLDRPDARPRELVLTFKDLAALTAFLERAAVGATVLDRSDALNAIRIRFEDLEQLAAGLARSSDALADVAPNLIFSVPGVPPRERRGSPAQVPFGNTALEYLGAADHRDGRGRGVTIAILDTGVAPDRTFSAARLSALDLGLGLNPGAGAGDGHGTAVAALAAGDAPDAPGVAPGSNLLSIRVTDASGTSDIFTLARAIVAATDAGARVINVSLGGYGTNAALASAITYAANRGAIIVAAGGNDQAAQLTWPAADPRVVSVGAVDRAEQQVTFSNSGPQLWLSAPGLGVQTAWSAGDRVTVNGTSASAPLVSGAIAAVLAENPGLTPAEAARRLSQYASDAGAPGADPAFGAGILNVGWALNATNPSYVDTAIAAHHYDAATSTLSVTVQNRSGRTVTGLTLSISAEGSSDHMIGQLQPAESRTLRVRVSPAAVAAGGLPITSTLRNPPGTADAVPTNNRRTNLLLVPPP